MAKDPWPNTRASIILRLQDPTDRDAWNLAVETYSPLIFQYCLSRGLQHSDAIDATQNVLIKLQKFEYCPDKGKFRGWLGTVARNQVNQFWRGQPSAKGRQQLELQPNDRALPSEPDLDWERISRAHILHSALTRIQPEFTDLAWQAFEKLVLDTENHETGGKRFVWVNDGSPDDVARQLNKTTQWVYKIKSKILGRLRDEILFLAEELSLLPE